MGTRVVSMTRVLVFMGIAMIVTGLATGFLVHRELRRFATVEADEKAKILIEHNHAIQRYYTLKLRPHIMELTRPVRSKDYFDPVWMSATYAVREIGKIFADEFGMGDYYYKESGVDARSPENEADDDERNFLALTKTDPDVKTHSDVKYLDGEPYYVTMRRGVSLWKPACMRCHSDPEAAPKDLVKLYGPTRSFHRNLGDLLTVSSIRVPLSKAYASSNRFSLRLSVLLIGLFCLFSLLLFWAHRRYLFNPLNKTLHDRERRINAIFSTAENVGFVISDLRDAKRPVLEFSPGAEKIFRCGSRDMIGKPASLLHLPEGDPAEKDSKAPETGDTERKKTRETVLTRKSGEAFPALLSAYPLTDDNGTVYASLDIVFDISDLREVEDALKASEAKYQDLYDHAPDMFVSVDAKTATITQCNQTLARELGYQKEEIIGRSIFDLYAEESTEYAKTVLFPRFVTTGTITEEELQLKRKDGAKIDVSLNTSAIRDGDGKVLGSRSVWRNITYRKQAEKEAEKLQLYLKNIIDSMPSILIGVNKEGMVTQWNQESQRITGLTPKDAEGRSLDHVMPILESQMALVQKALREKTPQTEQRIAKQSNGETRYSDFMVYPLIANSIEGAVIRVDDVTERVRIEQMMIQTEKMMSVGGLAAGMAHEINNPLSAIMQGVQNAIRRVSPDLEVNRRVAGECGTDLESVRHYLERRGILKYFDGMREAGLRAAKIVSNMLDFSRLSESKLAPTKINELVDNVLDLADSDYDLMKKYDFRHVHIVRDYDPHLSHIPCTATEIQQVFLNLIRNAAEAMAEKKAAGKSPRITIRTRNRGDHALIEIEDNGPGMETSTQNRMFEPFFTTKPVGAGTGLGLSVSYFIITSNHHGTLAVESEPGRGTKFIITLPLGKE